MVICAGANLCFFTTCLDHVAERRQEVVGEDHGHVDASGFERVFPQLGKNDSVHIVTLKRLNDGAGGDDLNLYVIDS